MVTVDDCIEAEEIFKEDEGVQRALRDRYGIYDPDEVACDPWYYGQRYSAPLTTQLSGFVSRGQCSEVGWLGPLTQPRKIR